MGCWYSKLDRQQMISRCKARKRYMKQFVKARHAFSAAHSLYLRSLRSTGAALLRFAAAETCLYRLPSPDSSAIQAPPLSPTRTANSEITNSSANDTPPPPPAASAWDFLDPFMPAAGRSADEEVQNQTAVDSEVVVAVNAGDPPSVGSETTTITSNEHAVVVSDKSKDLVEIIQELDEYFLKAANAGTSLSLLLDAPISDINYQQSSGKIGGSAKNSSPLLWTWVSGSVKWNAFGKFCEDHSVENKVDCCDADGNATHHSTVERLYTWEKKLYEEVKNAEYLKSEHEKKTSSLKKLEMKDGADHMKTEKSKKEVEKLESQIMVSLQTIETISTEIVKLRESELYPQLLQLVAGLMNMWRSMYEVHQVQMQIVQRLKYLNCIPSSEPTSEIHLQSTLQLELEVQQWLISFSNLIKAQRDYIQSLTGWLRLSLFQLGNNPCSKHNKDDSIYAFCEEWHLAINNAPEKVASEGLKSFLSIIHATVVQQAEEQEQKRRSESAFKELKKKAEELRSLESKHGPSSIPEASYETNKDLVQEKRTKMMALRAKAEDEKDKYGNSISITRAMTMSNLQMGLPQMFQALTDFACSCTQAFESVHNQAKSIEDLHNVKD